MKRALRMTWLGKRLLVVAVVVTALLAPAGGRAQSQGLPPSVLAGGVVAIGPGSVPATTNSITTATTLQGGPAYNFDVGVPSDGTAITNPTISVLSGYPPSYLLPNYGPPATSLPVVVSQPSLSPGGDFQLTIGWNGGGLISYQPGCDSSRSISPPTVPVGGGDQTFTFTVRCEDPSVKFINNGFVQGLLPGSTLVSFTPPDNLNQGEQLNAPPNTWNGTPGDMNAGFGFDLDKIVTGKQYTFGFVVHSPNPFGVPYAQTANIGLEEDSPDTECSGCSSPTSSVTVPVPPLDGPTPGAGSVTFSVGEPVIWLGGWLNSVGFLYGHNYGYTGTQHLGLDYVGEPSGVDGQPISLTAAWEKGPGLPEDGTPVRFTLGSQSCTASTSNLQAACSITLAQPVGSYTLQISSPGNVTVYPASTNVPFSITGPNSKDQCKKGAWRVFGIFKNQGDCVSYVATNGKNPPAR